MEKKPDLQKYFVNCQIEGIFEHHVAATDNGDNVIFHIHPLNQNGETLEFTVKGNELTQKNVSQEDNIREVLGQIIGGLPLERLKEVANHFGLNY